MYITSITNINNHVFFSDNKSKRNKDAICDQHKSSFVQYPQAMPVFMARVDKSMMRFYDFNYLL